MVDSKKLNPSLKIKIVFHLLQPTFLITHQVVTTQQKICFSKALQIITFKCDRACSKIISLERLPYCNQMRSANGSILSLTVFCFSRQKSDECWTPANTRGQLTDKVQIWPYTMCTQCVVHRLKQFEPFFYNTHDRGSEKTFFFPKKKIYKHKKKLDKIDDHTPGRKIKHNYTQENVFFEKKSSRILLVSVRSACV